MMSAIKPEQRFEILGSIQDQFNRELASFPDGLESDILRSYERDDFDSPGLLSLTALPYWIGDSLGVSYDICREMAVGNLFLLHSFQSFDFIVDDDRPGTSFRAQVILGNLCYLQVMRHYRPYFPADSLFWEKMEAYWHEWSRSILWEIESPNSRRPFEESYLIQSARKAAALKICPTGLALLADRVDLIPTFERSIDLMHAAMQLLDDLIDWQEDLQHGRYNAFLGLLVSNGYLAPDREPSAEDIAAIVFRSDILDQYTDITREYTNKAIGLIETLGIQPWTMLVDSLVGIVAHKANSYKRLMVSTTPEVN